MFDRLFNLTLAGTLLFLVWNLYFYCREHAVMWNTWYTLESIYWILAKTF